MPMVGRASSRAMWRVSCWQPALSVCRPP